ncbi:MAG: hypothetical protein HQK50_09440 [Oligoflexia bacterium]|nr:hypothetical protein [Oligoflexia bacterium]MBF0365784.1 hypothetical protein [Oligoflexia bacterium]
MKTIVFFILSLLCFPLLANELSGNWKVYENKDCRYDLSIEFTETSVLFKYMYGTHKLSLGKLETSTENNDNISDTKTKGCDLSEDKSKLFCSYSYLNVRRENFSAHDIFYSISTINYSIFHGELIVDSFSQDNENLALGASHSCIYHRVN